LAAWVASWGLGGMETGVVLVPAPTHRLKARKRLLPRLRRVAATAATITTVEVVSLAAWVASWGLGAIRGFRLVILIPRTTHRLKARRRLLPRVRQIAATAATITTVEVVFLAAWLASSMALWGGATEAGVVLIPRTTTIHRLKARLPRVRQVAATAATITTVEVVFLAAWLASSMALWGMGAIKGTRVGILIPVLVAAAVVKAVVAFPYRLESVVPTVVSALALATRIRKYLQIITSEYSRITSSPVLTKGAMAAGVVKAVVAFP
jgi:hypothetical protein